MDKERFELGLNQRKATLGAEYVENNLAAADDFTRPFGDITLFPRVVDDATVTARWINDIAVTGESFEHPPDIQRLPFGQSIVLY